MDCEMPQAFQQKMRKAKKEHKCCECHKIIAVGETYEYSSGVWDGRPASFKTCTECVAIRSEYTQSTGEPTSFCDLGSTIYDTFYRGFGPKEYAEESGFSVEQILKFYPDYYNE